MRKRDRGTSIESSAVVKELLAKQDAVLPKQPRVVLYMTNIGTPFIPLWKPQSNNSYE